MHLMFTYYCVFCMVATKHTPCLHYFMPILRHLASNLHLLFCFVTCFILISTRLFHYFPENTFAKVPKDLRTATFNGYINSEVPYAMRLEFFLPLTSLPLCVPRLSAPLVALSLLFISSSTISPKLPKVGAPRILFYSYLPLISMSRSGLSLYSYPRLRPYAQCPSSICSSHVSPEPWPCISTCPP